LEITNLNRNRFILAGLVGLVAGSIIGLIYGYIINPVEWADVPMELARADLQEDYLRMAIDSYKLYFDKPQAFDRWQELGDAGPELLAKVIASPGTQGLKAINSYKELVTFQDTINRDVICGTNQEGTNNNLCVFLWLGTVTFGGALGIFLYYRSREPILRRSSSRFAKPKAKGSEEIRPFITDDAKPPLVHSMTTFVLGDDLFDESFSIDTPSGEFLGECGIGIVNTIDDGSPKKVNAFDVWLFDKNEIDTKSIVLMSEQAYGDDILRTQLESKGSPVLAEIGGEITLNTNHLLMRVRIVDMLCEEGDPQKCEYFQRLSLELVIREQN
jgi:hypothetical protein